MSKRKTAILRKRNTNNGTQCAHAVRTQLT